MLVYRIKSLYYYISVSVVNAYLKFHLLAFHWNHLSCVTGYRGLAFCELKNCRETITSPQKSCLTTLKPSRGHELTIFVPDYFKPLFLVLLVLRRFLFVALGRGEIFIPSREFVRPVLASQMIAPWQQMMLTGTLLKERTSVWKLSKNA